MSLRIIGFKILRGVRIFEFKGKRGDEEDGKRQRA